MKDLDSRKARQALVKLFCEDPLYIYPNMKNHGLDSLMDRLYWLADNHFFCDISLMRKIYNEQA